MNPRPFKCVQLVWKIGGESGGGGGWRNDFIKRTICLDKGKANTFHGWSEFYWWKTREFKKLSLQTGGREIGYEGCPADQHWPPKNIWLKDFFPLIIYVPILLETLLWLSLIESKQSKSNVGNQLLD